MSEASSNAAHLPASGSRRRPGPQTLLTAPRHPFLEHVGSFVGASGSTLALVGFALPMAAGGFQGDGYGTFLLLVLRGNWAHTSTSGGRLGWELLPLVGLLGVSVLAAPLTLSLTTARTTQRFPRLSLGVGVLSGLLLWYIVGATFCLAAGLLVPLAFGALVLLLFRNPAQSHPWLYALVPLVGLLGYGGGIALYVAEGVHWTLGNPDSAGSQTFSMSVGIGFWLCATGWLLATLGGTLLWQAQQPAKSR